jgi:putative membrane protein
MKSKHLHPASIFYFIVAAAYESLSYIWVFPLLVLFIQGKMNDHISSVFIGVVTCVFLALMFLVIAFLKWRAFTYVIGDKAIYIQSGLFVTKKRWITPDRIQSIDSTIRINDHLFSTQTLTIELAGTDEGSITMSCISNEEEQRIRATLQVRLKADSLNSVHESAIQLSKNDLILHSVLSPKFGIILTLLSLGLLKYWDSTKETDRSTLFTYLSSWFGANWIPITIILFILLSFVLSLIFTFETDYHFKIKKNNKGELEVEQGLFEKKHRTIAPDRIQALQIIERPLLRLLGYVSIQAIVIRNSKEEQKEKTISILPFIKKTKVLSILESFTGYQKSTIMYTLTKGARFRYIVLPVIVGILISSPIILFVPTHFKYLALLHDLALLLPFALLFLGWMEYRMIGWNQDEHYLTIQYGILTRRTVIIKRGRIQWAALRQTTLQERKQLASIKIVVASGKENVKYSLSHIPFDEAFRIYKSTLKRKKEG